MIVYYIIKNYMFICVNSELMNIYLYIIYYVLNK